MVRRVALLGGGGHAADLVELLSVMTESADPIEVVIGDDDWDRPERFADMGGPHLRLTLSTVEEAARAGDIFYGATGYPKSRHALVSQGVSYGCTVGSALVHPRAEVAMRHSIGNGSVVQGLAWLSPGVQIGASAYVGYGAKLGHDTEIGDFVSVMPGAFVGGDCIVEDQALVGANATVLQGIRIGVGAQVGAGAVVTTNVEDGDVVVGSPARRIKRSKR